MSANIDRLYELLPAIHRIRDAEQGEPLKALLRVIAEQVNLVEDNIARLYDDWFIETCEDWVVPYIADLVGYRQIHEAGEPGDVRSRAERVIRSLSRDGRSPTPFATGDVRARSPCSNCWRTTWQAGRRGP